MRTLVSLLVCSALLMLPQGARAQSEIRISSVQVEILPEYDQPAVLVIYFIELVAGTDLPVDLNFKVPADATIHAVAYLDPSGGLYNLPYQREVEGQWALLSFAAGSPKIQIEYYEPLNKDELTRHVVYQWQSDYPVDALVVQFQQPIGATDLQISPQPEETGVTEDGLAYYRSEVMSLDAGQTFIMEVDYQKATDVLTVSSMGVQPSAPLDNTIIGRISWTQIMPLVLGGLGILLVLGGLIAGLWYVQSKQNRRSAPRRRYTRREQKENGNDLGSLYCHECGRRAQSGDRFCRSCGSRLRHGES